MFPEVLIISWVSSVKFLFFKCFRDRFLNFSSLSLREIQNVTSSERGVCWRCEYDCTELFEVLCVAIVFSIFFKHLWLRPYQRGIDGVQLCVTPRWQVIGSVQNWLHSQYFLLSRSLIVYSSSASFSSSSVTFVIMLTREALPIIALVLINSLFFLNILVKPSFCVISAVLENLFQLG